MYSPHRVLVPARCTLNGLTSSLLVTTSESLGNWWMAAVLRSTMFTLALGQCWQLINCLYTLQYIVWDCSALTILKPTANSKLISSHRANILIPPRLRKFLPSSAQRLLRADSFLCSLSACWEKLIRFTWVLRLLVLLTVCLSHGTVDSASKAIWHSSAYSHVYSPFTALALVCLTE